MATPKAWLGGVPLANAAAVAWAEVAGVHAPTAVWTVHDKQWQRLKGQMGVPLELRIVPSTGAELSWKNLYVLREVPAGKPFHRSFLVSDVRWMWPRCLVSRSYNIPRKTGNRRLVGEGPVEIEQAIDTYGYAYSSLDKGVKWSAMGMVADVLRRVAEQSNGHPWHVESFPINEQRQVTVEGLDLSESGDTALGHALAHAPGANVTVNRFGEAVVFDMTRRSDVRAQLDPSVPRTSAGSIDRMIDLAPIRPSDILVYFQREVELRFDAYEEGATVETRDPNTDERMLMENVLPLPDVETTIAGERVALGTYVPVWRALAAWNDDLASLGSSVPPPALTVANVRKYWFVLEALYTPLGELTLNAAQSNWVARIATLRAHYRQTYQIPRSWMQRMRDMTPTRVGILDYVTKSRNPSRAWSQFMAETTTKAHYLSAVARTDKQWVWENVDNYPGIDGELSDKSSSPAVVQVVDKDLGILHINYRLDPHGMRSQIVPSRCKEGGSGRLQSINRDAKEQRSYPMSSTGRVTGSAPVALADDFRVAIVFTASPFAPNNEKRLFGYRVRPEDVSGAVGQEFQVSGGTGPTWHLFIPPGLMTARYAWSSTEKARESAQRLFGFKDGLPEAGTNDPFEAPGYFIVNMAGSRGGEGGLIEALARAAAVSQWAAFVDQVEGAPALHLRPGVSLRGSMQAVAHRLDQDGRLVTQVTLSGERVPIDPMAALPHAVRQKILGLVMDGVA